MKKLISLMLAAIMCIGTGMLPVFAGGEMYGSYITIGNGVERPINKSASGEGWIYNESCVLILNNYNGETIYFYSNYETRKNLTIILIGENTINGMLYSGSNTTAYGMITIKSAVGGSLKVTEIDGAPFIIDNCTVSVNHTLPDYYETRVQNGGVLNVNEDNSGGSLATRKICADGGTVNIFNRQESYLRGKENLSVSNGGVINITSPYYSGAILSRYDSTALTDFLVTDFNGSKLKIADPRSETDISGKLVNPAAPNVPVMNVRISEYCAVSKGGNRVDDWAETDINSVIDENLMPSCLAGKDLRKEISRAEFAETAVVLYEKMSGETIKTEDIPFEDLTDVSETLVYNISKAYSAGLINGMSDTEFYPDAALTREQASTILYRIYKKLGGQGSASENAFADDSSISPWARDAVYFMAGNGILKGMGDNLFAPKSNTQAQQALVIVLRMFKSL